MKIVLVRPNWITRRMILPPLGLGYISAAAKREGHECFIHDSWLYDEDPYRAANQVDLLYRDADVVGVQVYQNTIEWTKRFISMMRYFTKAKLIIGGPIPTALGEEARELTGADAVVQGEFETDITDSLTRIFAGETLIPWERWVDVNEFPFLDWDAMPLPPYFEYIYSAGAPVRGKRVGFIQRTRGCPRKCTFCASGGIIMGQSVRFRSLTSVLAEVEYQIKRWGIDELWFQDDDVTINYTKGLELFRALTPYKLHIRLQMGIRCNNLTEEMLYCMNMAGVYYAGLGIESGVPRVLGVIKKELDLDRMKDAILHLDLAGIQTMGFFMFGLNTETRAEMEETVRWALNTKLHHAQFAIYIPYPGSEDYNNGFVPALPREELLKIQQNATLRFYLRPRILWGMIRHFKWKQAKAILLHPWFQRWFVKEKP